MDLLSAEPFDPELAEQLDPIQVFDFEQQVNRLTFGNNEFMASVKSFSNPSYSHSLLSGDRRMNASVESQQDLRGLQMLSSLISWQESSIDGTSENFGEAFT